MRHSPLTTLLVRGIIALDLAALAPRGSLMHRLTARRFAAVQPLLDQFRTELFARWSFNVGRLEQALREIWHVKEVELTEIMRDLLNDDRFREVAADCMEHRNTAGVAPEFQQPLAQLYGALSRGMHRTWRRSGRRSGSDRFRTRVGERLKSAVKNDDIPPAVEPVPVIVDAGKNS